MTRRVWIPLVLVIAAILAVVAIVGLRSGYGEDEPLEIYVILKATSPQMEFWQVVRQGIEAAAREHLVATTVVGPWLEHQVDDQIAIMQGVIESSPDGIVLAASDYDRLRAPVQRAIQAGIPVVTVDSDVDNDQVVSFVGTNNVEAGRRAGEEMLNLVRSDATIAIVSHVPGVATAIEREEGVRQALDTRAGSGTTLGPDYAMNDEDRAREIVERLVSPEIGVDGIIALNETSTVGVSRAIADLGLEGKVRVVGFDASTDEVSFLERGVVQALVVQKPFNMGYLSLETLARRIRGESVEERVDTGSVVVRATNMYDEDVQRLIFPLVQ
ncbi:MAG: substrate-binding domain-containing protein [Alkalispirochaeta sp.]